MTIALQHHEQHHETNELDELRAEVRVLTDQRDQLALLCQTQLELLHEIGRDNLVINRADLQQAGPTLRALPVASLRTFVRIIEDLAGDETRHAWTGRSMGQAIGLANATRDRLFGPLEEAAVIEQKDGGRHKARQYRLALAANNTLSARVAMLETRYQSVVLGTVPGGVSPTEIAGNTPPQRVTGQKHATTARFGVPKSSFRQKSPLNTLPQRVSGPLVCMYVDSESPDLPDSTTYKQTAWSPDETRVIRDAWNGLGLSRELKRRLHQVDAETALGLLLHVKAEGRRPGALLYSMLQRGSGPEASYLKQARYKLAGKPEPEYPMVPTTIPESEPYTEPAPPDPSLDEPIKGNWTPCSVWQALSGQLSLQLGQPAFDLYVKPAKLLRFEEDTLWVECERLMAAKWIDARKQMLDHIASSIAGTTIAVRVQKAEGADRRAAPISSPMNEKEYTTS